MTSCTGKPVRKVTAGGSRYARPVLSHSIQVLRRDFTNPKYFNEHLCEMLSWVTLRYKLAEIRIRFYCDQTFF